MRKIAIIAAILFSAGCLYAQEGYDEISSPSFFAAPVIETVWYGRTSPSIGYGFSIGSEGIISIGLKGIYAMPLAEFEITTLEVTLFFRVYLPVTGPVSGFFTQLTYGFAVFSRENQISLPADGGTFSLGLTAGWRFPIGSRFFIEPYIRGGYPYYGGAGLCAGVRF